MSGRTQINNFQTKRKTCRDAYDVSLYSKPLFKMSLTTSRNISPFINFISFPHKTRDVIIYAAAYTCRKTTDQEIP